MFNFFAYASFLALSLSNVFGKYNMWNTNGTASFAGRACDFFYGEAKQLAFMSGHRTWEGVRTAIGR